MKDHMTTRTQLRGKGESVQQLTKGLVGTIN